MGCSVSKLKSSESQENLDHQALKNKLVLEKICSFLCFDDLKSFRVVNQNWNRAALPGMRKVSVLNLTDMFKVRERHLQLKEKWNTSTAEGFMSRLLVQPRWVDMLPGSSNIAEGLEAVIKLIRSNSIYFPCLTFCMGTVLSCVEPSLFNDMLVSIAPFVRELDLEIEYVLLQCNITNLEFPNLSTIRIDEYLDVHYHYDDDINEQHYDSLELRCFQQILQASPNLKTAHLTIVGDSKRIGSYIQAMAYTQCLKIENLHLYIDIQDAHLAMLQTIRVTLKQMKISMGYDSAYAPENLKTFLESQSGSLEKLELECHWVSSMRQPMPITFPRMQNIQFLKLGICNFLYPGLCYKQIFPCLKHLVIGDNDNFVYNRIEQVLNSGMKPLSTVQILEFGQWLDNPEIINQAARIFPNLIKLKVGGTEAVLKAVGYAMTKLEDLTLAEWQEDAILTNITFVGYLQRKLGNDNRLWNGVGNLVFERNKNNTIFFQSLKVLQIEIERVTDLGQIKPISAKNRKRPASFEFLQSLLE